MCPLPGRCDSGRRNGKGDQEVDTGLGLTFMKWLFCADHRADVCHHWVCVINCERRTDSATF